MSKGKLGALIAFLVLIAIGLIIGGQYAGGIFLLKRLGLDWHNVGLFTLTEYRDAYGQMAGPVGKLLKIATAISFAPALIPIAMGAVALFNRKSQVDDLYGNARFATDSEIRRANMFVDQKNTSEWPPLLLGQKDGRFVVDSTQEYTTLAAPPGAGKGVSFVIPNLLFYTHNVVNFDPKLENFRITSGYRHSVLGHDVFVFTPDNTQQTRMGDDEHLSPQSIPAEATHCWNPLDYISDDPRRSLFDIKTITAILIDAPTGQNQGFYLDARKALDGILLYLIETPEQERTMFNAGVINDTPMGFDKWAPSVIASRAKSGNPLSEQCVRLLMSYANEDSKKRSTTRGIISTALDPFADPYARAATCRSSFDFRNLRRKKMSVYVGIAPSNIPKFQRMLNLFFAQAIAVNTDVLPADGPVDNEGKPVLKYQVLFLLDEFVALGPIEIIRASSGYTRAYNVRYAIVFQNKAQVFAEQCYGAAGGASLLDTFHNEIVFATESVEEAKEYSERLGYTTLKHKEKSRTRSSGGPSTTENTQRYQRALMLPQDIQRLPYEEQLFFKKGGKLHPVKMHKIFWYKDERLKGRGNLPLPEIPPMDFQTAA
ncbi:Protein VirD4 [Pseudomonas fluorescens]|uniref:type IV secretory system conjugative DNA transfer family protein n=1 Tax=Pseudomonas fluorescens TaxID=294 RepID=UPI0012402229|nr:type IV secretory system conjugative DNA transfer family protein [Pseudomonas fluorescens]VVN22473.1 Protein VirD4 [Pseudomonas fluorescens]